LITHPFWSNCKIDKLKKLVQDKKVTELSIYDAIRKARY
jgi:hypothetical protein